MTAELALFYTLAALAVVSAVAMIVAKSTVHAVLFMAGNFLVTGVLYLLLHAPFLAAVQVIVYAGAIMVLFLFVVMLMGPNRTGLEEPLSRHRAAALIALVALGVGLLAAVGSGGLFLVGDAGETAGGLTPGGAFAPVPDEFGSPAEVGVSLLTQHLVAFEVVSVLLLVAVLGAVVIGHFKGEPA